MTPTYVRILVKVELESPRSVALENVPSQETAARIIQVVLAKLGLTGAAAGWVLEFQGIELPADAPIGLYLGAAAGAIELTLRRKASPAPLPYIPVPQRASPPMAPASPAPAPSAPPPIPMPAPAPGGPIGGIPADTRESLEPEGEEECVASLGAAEEDFDLALEDPGSKAEELVTEFTDTAIRFEPAPQASASDNAFADEEMDQAAPATRARTPARSKSKTLQTRRATVRYYSRMNPERLYPLLLILSKEMVAEIQKKHVAQRTSQAFGVSEELPIEVEPILPGCDCYPPKIVTKLSQSDQTLTFRVAPRVLGKIDGASVVIQQAHSTLARIDLEMKVVKRTWVVIWGLITFLLPALSTALQYLGLDFSTRGQGFNLYLSLAQLVFEIVPPFWLTLGLALMTGFAYWFTRPVGRDVFWDVKTISLADRLKQIEYAFAEDPGKARIKLGEFLEAAPDYQPAHLLAGKWHYQAKEHEPALSCFQRAFRLGAAQPTHYQMASLAAARLGQNRQALLILQDAEKVLSPQKIPGVLLFNMACYHTRLGNPEAAMDCLARAVRNGFRKVESFLKDPDLAPLRARPDFRGLLSGLKATAEKIS